MEFFIRESTARAGIPQAQSGVEKNNSKTVSATGLPDVETETSKPSCQKTNRTHKDVWWLLVFKVSHRKLFLLEKKICFALMSRIGSSDRFESPPRLSRILQHYKKKSRCIPRCGHHILLRVTIKKCCIKHCPEDELSGKLSFLPARIFHRGGGWGKSSFVFH